MFNKWNAFDRFFDRATAACDPASRPQGSASPSDGRGTNPALPSSVGRGSADPAATDQPDSGWIPLHMRAEPDGPVEGPIVPPWFPDPQAVILVEHFLRSPRFSWDNDTTVAARLLTQLHAAGLH